MDDKWEDKFQALIRYKAENGHTNVPAGTWADLETLDDPDSKVSFAIGSWVHDQRRAYKNGKLKTERKDKLLEQGFKFRLHREYRKSDEIKRDSKGRRKKRQCTVTGCTKNGRVPYNDMCSRHYKESTGRTVRRDPRPSDQIERDSNGRAKRRQCTVTGCTKEGVLRYNDMCICHYRESTGTVTLEPRKYRKRDQIERDSNGRAKPRQCTVEGCTKQGAGQKNNHMCMRHYRESK